MACGICSGVLVDCPVCHARNMPFESHPSWEERLDSRRHKGSHESAYLNGNDFPAPARHGLYSIDNGGDRTGPKYQREFNDQYDGPGKGTW